MLQPAVVQSSASRAARIAELPLSGHESHIPACFLSALLALVGVYFVPRESVSAEHEGDAHDE